jgi:hypothetical protein
MGQYLGMAFHRASLFALVASVVVPWKLRGQTLEPMGHDQGGKGFGLNQNEVVSSPAGAVGQFHRKGTRALWGSTQIRRHPIFDARSHKLKNMVILI